jgi:hypothetical protein
MKPDLTTKLLLALIAAFLGVIALRPVDVQAQATVPDLYFEPGFHLLRKPDGTVRIQGKVAIDRRTGAIWGFPTGVDGPYPVNVTGTEPPVSKPMYLGKFDLLPAK